MQDFVGCMEMAFIATADLAGVRHWGTDNPRYKRGDYFGTSLQNAADALASPPADQVPLPAHLGSDSSASS